MVYWALLTLRSLAVGWEEVGDEAGTYGGAGTDGDNIGLYVISMMTR